MSVEALPRAAAAGPERAPDRALGRFARAFRRNPGAVAGLVVLLVLLALALLAPVLAPYDPIQISPADLLGPPSGQHWFGTDEYGRDILSRVLLGSRLTLCVGLVSVAISAVCGSVLGLLAGYYGGLTDTVIMRLIDVKLAFPSILLAMGIVAVLGPSLTNLMIAVGIGGIATYTRVVRASVLSAKEYLYVLAARAAGCTDRRIMFVHLLPNVLAPVIVLSALSVAGAILAASGLSFIGLGAQPPSPEWGAMLNDGQNYLRDAWWMTTFPGLAIMITVMAVNRLGDGLRDALDPRLRL
ncbi:MAG TPA: ABC transporter permease [Thermomicrobiales bacterium]|nr:ABC transporter permease [Thermomicrobiales bacterium]